MLGVMYTNAHLPIILATMARRRDHRDFERGVSNKHIGGLKGVCVRASVCVKHQIMKFPMEEWCRIPRIEFQTLVESMPRCIEAVLVCDGSKCLLRHFGVSFILAVTCTELYCLNL